MADTTARALQLLELLQSALLRTVAELAGRLGVDERTVRRDVARLVDLGVPVETLRGRYGGYRLAPGQRVLPLMFSNEEVVSVYLGLAHVQAASPRPEVAAQTALSKIKRALPTDDAKRIDSLLGAMTRTSQHGGVAPDPAVMLTLAEAANGGRVLDMRYRSRTGVPSRRTIHPYGLIGHSGRWYLIAFDTDAQEERAFRVDRIRTARSMPGSFAAPQIDLESRLLDLFADGEYRWQVVLRIRETEDRIRVQLPRSVARLERLESKGGRTCECTPPWHRVEINAENLDWIPPVLAALDCEVLIEGPEELRDKMRAAAARMLHAAGEDVRSIRA